MESLRLVLRGLRWRWGASLTVFLVAVVAMAGSALGPLYAHSASDSLVREGLATAEPVTTGVETRGAVAGQTQFTPSEVLAAVEARAAAPELDAWYLPGTLGLSVRNGSPSLRGDNLGIAEIGWYRGQCEGVTIVDGRCPTAAREAMVSSRTAEEGRIGLGDPIRLGASSDAAADTVTVVGTYDALSADPRVWGLGSPDQARPGSAKGEPDRLDEIVVGPGTLEDSRGDVTAYSFRPIDATRVHLDDAANLSAAMVAATDTAGGLASDGPRTVVTSGVVGYLADLDPALAEVSAASLAVTIQLVMLAWFVLFLIVSAMSDERGGEIALAKLRGMSRRSTVAFGLAEPVLLLVVAVPVGLVIAYAANALLTDRYLAPGSQAIVTPLTLVALAVCLLGGVAAAALAARGILRSPVLDQLKRSGGRRARLVRSAAIDAIAVALALAGIYQLTRGQSDVVALLAPGLIALAIGLLAARAMPVLARANVARTRGSARVASFLASRNIARRPAGLRILVLLSLAVGLATFAVDGWAVASSNRLDEARAQVGAATVLQVRAASPGALLAAVDEVDPTGAEAMAAVAVTNGQGGLLAVDSQRLAAVSVWDPAWVGLSMPEAMAWLHPAATTEPVLVRGGLGITTDLTRVDGAAEMNLGVVVRDADGLPSEVSVGDVPDGSATLSADLPMCEVTACTLVGFTLRQPIDRPSSGLSATLDVSDVTDDAGPVDLSPAGVDGWRSGLPATQVPVERGAEVVSSDAGVTRLQIDVESGDAAVEVADRPEVLPVLHGAAFAESSGSTRVSGLDDRFVAAESGGEGVLPRLGSEGTLADLRYALAATGTSAAPMVFQVWLAADAPDAIRADLEAAGLEVLGEESVEDRLAVLDRTGVALALRLFVITALLSLGLAAGTLLAHSFVMIRRRAYELATVKALGSSHALAVRTARRELLILVVTGLLLGLASGLIAAAAALPALLGRSGADAPPAWFGPAWVPVLVLGAGTLVLLSVIADISARATARRATPDLLRQVQE